MLGDVKGEGALVVGHLRARDGGLILRGLQAVLALLAAFEGVADAEVELRAVADVGRIELRQVEEREELRVPGKGRVRPQVGGDFLGLILHDGGAGRFERVIVRERELDGLLERDARGRRLRERGANEKEKQDPGRGQSFHSLL